jgi:DNA-binding winged helix-turn-helix (wHTH) protein
MVGNHEILFAPFRLDRDNQQLWRGEQPLALQPKPLAVLQYLAQHAGRLISKEGCVRTHTNREQVCSDVTQRSHLSYR